MDKINLWSWNTKVRTMLRYIKVGDIVCFEIDASKEEYGYGILIAKLPYGFVFRALNIRHFKADNIKINELQNAKPFGKLFILDAYSTLDKKNTKDGEWRIIGNCEDYCLSKFDIDNVFFEFGVNGMKKKINLLGKETPITDNEAKNYELYSPVSGDEAKKWYIKYT